VLAVLPFVDLSVDQVEDHFCEGLAEEILLALSRVEGLRVRSRTSSFFYKESGLSTREVGCKLGVNAVLAGSIRREGTRLILEAEMLQIPSGDRAWTDRFDREHMDVFKLVEEISGRAANAFHLSLEPGPSRAAVNLEAYDDYLRGRQHYFQYHRLGMRAAMQAFQQALDKDPAYAAAWAGMANAAAFLYTYVDRSEASLELARSASQKALELDPNLAEAHASRGVALSSAGEAEEAEEAFERALRLDPYLWEAAYGFARHCFAAGKMEQAILFFEQAASIRPEDCQAILLVAQVYHRLGIEDEAAAARRRGLALAEARLHHFPKDARTRYLGANALAALGEREKALEWARIARSLDPEDCMLIYNLACIHALASDPEEALDCLELAVSSGPVLKAWFINDPDLESIRGLPRFQALIQRIH
jgi:TolB-like protein/Flp pilus assembly protein TadD